MVRTCTGLVCVRRSLRVPSAFGWKKNVSCISRAGWPSGKFSLVKLVSSSSMSGPSAMEKPMSAKIAVSSSITWLIGWMRPVSTGASRTGSVTSTVSEARRASSAASFRMSRRAFSAADTLSFSALMTAPCVLRSSGDILPSVASRAEIDPFLPRTPSRTASSAASSLAAAMAPSVSVSRAVRSDMPGSVAGDEVTARLLPCRGALVEVAGHNAKSPARGRAFHGSWMLQAVAGRAALAWSTMALKATGSWMASSERTLRSTVMPARARPSMKRL